MSEVKEVKQCGDVDVRTGRLPDQIGWYQFVAHTFAPGKTLLDAGCGLGDGLAILEEKASMVRGQDLDPRLARPNVLIQPLEEFQAKSFDVVTSFDVVEHVEDPVGFLGQLARIAREGFFLSTPNWTASRCQWPYHIREYTPSEFFALLAPFGKVHLFKGTSFGDKVYPVKHLKSYFLLNRLRNWRLTAFGARCWGYLLPPHRKIHNHNAAWVEL